MNGADASVDAVRRELVVATNEGREARPKPNPDCGMTFRLTLPLAGPEVA